MVSLIETLASMHRPAMLVRAARIAAQSRNAQRRAERRSMQALLNEERQLNAARLGGGLGYSPTRHVEVMSAILSAARATA